jgi:hypothetical protein
VPSAERHRNCKNTWPSGHALVLRLFAALAQNGCHEDSDHGTADIVTPGQLIAQAVRQTQTHSRTGTSGNTRSTRWAARSAMRRPPQLEQNPRPLHEKATSRSNPQAAHRKRARAQ